MYGNYLLMAVIMAISVLLLVIFVKRNQVRKAFFALMLAQLFSWPITLLYVEFGLQENPIRLFANATAGSFLFAFMFHPSVFVVYYLHYPYRARKLIRILYSVAFVAFPVMLQFLVSLFSDLIHYPNKLSVLGAYCLILLLYNISRIYIDWYYRTYIPPEV